ncbi:MAG: flagellar export chaperone FliS [Candidatus Saccharibacteria bacterium]
MSTNSQAYSQYKTSMIETASPAKLLLMLYDAAIRNLERAKQAIDDKDNEATHKHLVKAQDIILELMYSLNMDYEISKSLFSLYEYMHHQLVQANVKKNKEMIDEVLTFMVELRNTWDEAIKKLAASSKTAEKTTERFDVKG